MKIAVAADGGSLAAHVAERFARAPWFVIVDSVTLAFTAVPNPAVNMGSGAGPTAANELAGLRVEIAVAGRVGPKAESALERAGIRFAAGGGTVATAVRAAEAEAR
jgi:predicted Fe-Mo cluster-binding NifX family protein